MNAESRRIVRELLDMVPTLSLATVDESGDPHAANLNFVADADHRLYWLSALTSAHSLHLAARPAVAATVYPPFDSPAQIRGLQIHGRGAVCPEGDFDRLWPLFCAKFAYAAAMEERARSQRFYVLQPGWIRLIDNAVHFGFKAEWDLTKL